MTKPFTSLSPLLKFFYISFPEFQFALLLIMVHNQEKYFFLSWYLRSSTNLATKELYLFDWENIADVTVL